MNCVDSTRLPARTRAEFFCSFWKRKGGEFFGYRYLTTQRIARLVAQAFPQKGRQKRCAEHRAPQTLVRFKERVAPHPEEKSDPPH